MCRVVRAYLPSSVVGRSCVHGDVVVLAMVACPLSLHLASCCPHCTVPVTVGGRGLKSGWHRGTTYRLGVVKFSQVRFKLRIA
jgi:hypothetical protein